MPHIHEKPGQHDLTVSAYIVRTDGAEPKVFLHRHRKIGKLLPFGGHVELTETPWQAIAHEIEEESGYVLSQLEVLQPISRLKVAQYVNLHPYPLAMNTHDSSRTHFHTDIQYGFVTNEDPAGLPAEGESQELLWLTVQEIKALHKDQMYANNKEMCEFVCTEALSNWECVPAKTYLLDHPEAYFE